MSMIHRQLTGVAVGLLLAHSSMRVLGAGGTWTNNANGIWSNTACWASGTPADGATYTATFAGPPSGITADTTITLEAPRTIGNLLFTNNNGHTWLLAGSNLTFDADGIGGSTSTVCVATNAAQFGLKMRGTTNSVLNKTGAGQFVLGADNTGCYSGRVVVTQGSLALNNANATVSTRGLTLGGGDDNVSVGFANNVTQNGSAYTVAGTGTGTVTIAWGIANSLTLNPTLVLNKTLIVNSTTANGLWLASGPSGVGGVYKTGSGLLAYNYNSTASYSGTTTVSQGSILLCANAGSVLPSGNTVVLGDANTGANAVSIYLGGDHPTPSTNLRITTNGSSASLTAGWNGFSVGNHVWSGTIQIDRPYLTVGCNSYASSLGIGAIISGAGGLWVANATGYRTSVTSANSYTGGTVVASGILRTGNASALGSNAVVLLSATNVILDLNSTLLTADSLTTGIVTPTIDNAGASYTSTPAVVVSGGGGSGAAATATLTGGKVTAITITSRGVNYRSAPTFTLSGGNPLTNAVITGVYNPSSVALGSGTLNISGPQSGLAVCGGNIAGTGNLIMNGSGMQVLTGSNTYSGATTISNGALVIDGALFGTGGVMTVKSGAIFGGTGLVQRVVTVETGGVLAAAFTNAIGTLTLSTNLNLKSGAILDVALNGSGTGDQIVVQGTPNLNSDSGAGSQLRLSAAGRLVGGQAFKIIDNQSTLPVQGNFANEHGLSVMTGSGLVRLSVSYAGGDGNDVVLTVINNSTAVFFR